MRLALLLLALIGFAAPALAQDPPEIVDIRGYWEGCSEMLSTAPDDWTGWRVNYDGGYANHFEFHEGGDGSVSVLVQTWLIDAIATQTDTACYRPDGRLAFIFSEMVSPNVAENSEGAILVREGRIYFAPDGEIIRVLSKILYEDHEVAQYDNEHFMLARGCDLTTPHMTVADIRLHMDHELGTIEGDHPTFTPSDPIGWCYPD
jgi:hypothetical protein